MNFIFYCSFAGRIKENPQALYALRRKRVPKEIIYPLKDRGGNVCVEQDEADEYLNEYSA